MNFNIDLENDHEIKLGAHTIKVLFVLPDHPDLKGDFGLYDTEKFTIYINKNNPTTLKFSTLLHELIHAIEHVYAFSMNHTWLNLIAEGLAQIILDKKESTKDI